MGCLLVSYPSGTLISNSPWIHLYPHLTVEKATQNLRYLLIEASAQVILYLI